MKSSNQKRIVSLYSFISGVTDVSTGLGLVFLPAWTLALMGIDSSLYPLSIIRFIGTFVFGVGSLYLWGIYFQMKTGKWELLRMVWLATAWMRACVAVVTGWMVYSGDLAAGWISVPLTDALLGIFQFVWIGIGRFPRDD